MIKWYLNRLRTLSLKEIPFRLNQFLLSKYEKYFIAGKTISNCKFKIHQNTFGYEGNNAEIFQEIINVFGKQVDFTQQNIDWHADVFSGEKFLRTFSKSLDIRHNPNLSAKNVWEINRLQILIFLALNYNHTEDKKYLLRFISIANSWIENNPYLIGINWYSNIEVNIRLIVWYFCWQLLYAEDLMDIDKDFKEFVESKWIPAIYQHCRHSFKNPSKYSSSNNHLISEYAGLFVATSLWEFSESKKWNKYSKAGLEHEIIRQHSKNGVNKEEAAEYIQFITDFFLLSYVVGENSKNNFSPVYIQQLRKIFIYISDFLDIDGNFPQYGDEDDGRCLLFDQQSHFNNFKSILTSGAIIFNDPVLKANSSGIDNKNKVLFGVKCINKFEKIAVLNSEASSAFYEDEGHLIFRKRETGKEIYMHFDAAPLGFLSIAAHGHADALSFILHVDGQPVLIDSGTYTYHTEPEWRKYFMSTLAHNTIRINKKNQATIAGPTLWLNHYETKVLSVHIDDETEKVSALHMGYKQCGIIHEREIFFNKVTNHFKITDIIKTQNNKDYHIEIPFHIHPLLSVKKTAYNCFEIINVATKRNVILSMDKNLPVEILKGQTSPEIVGWYSKSFMCKEPSTTLLSSFETTGFNRIETIITIN